MRHSNITRTGLGLALVGLAFIHPSYAQGPRLFNGFETAEEVAAASPNSNQVKPVSQHATQGTQALRIEFQPGTDWPSVAFAAPTPWDWHEWGMLAVDVTNPGTEMVEVGIGAGDAPETGAKHWSSGMANIPPGGTVTIGFPLGAPAQDMGMDGMPSQIPNCTLLRAYGEGLDLKRIALFTFFTRAPKSPTAIIVDNIRLARTIPLDKIVDKFGQYTGAQWPGKVSQDADLVKAQDAEEADWKAHPRTGLDRFGGWEGGPKLQASGYFRTQKVNGKWWLVDPEGRLFFSTGITTINHNEPLDQFTRITGRESLFSWLPDANNPFDARHTSVRGEQRFFNFYDANLERKYGSEYELKWLATTKSRLLSWGFNTVGDFSSRAVTKMGVPYCAMLGAWGGHRRVQGGSIDIDDPYDPQFATDLANNLKNLAADIPNDPYCIGYFVDNELSWGGSASAHDRFAVVLAVLGLSADSPAKRAFLNQLQKSDANIAALNARWGTNFPNWEMLQSPFTPDSKQEAAMKADLAAFMTAFASKYYRTVRETVKAHDPNHLYLGDKYMVSRYTPESLQSAASYCDVVSFDIYESDVASSKWEFLKTQDKPCIVGEFHFGALDRGMFGSGMLAVSNQAERGAAYTRYVNSVAEHPAFVGCHWFQYVDEPLTARAFDRENHNVGFVDGRDIPYPEMVAAARKANSSVYARRYQNRGAAK